MSKKIKKAKVKNNRTLYVEFIEFKDDGTEFVHKIDGNALVHDDLIASFAKLVFHFIFLCDLKESTVSIEHESFDPEIFPQLKVSGFTVGGDTDDEGVVLTGTKKINHKMLNLNSPLQKYSNEDEYMHSHELAEDIQACIYEVKEYLFNGKYAVKQEEITFGDDEEKTGPEILAEISGDDGITDVEFENAEEAA